MLVVFHIFVPKTMRNGNKSVVEAAEDDDNGEDQARHSAARTRSR
jgi:hypothetical protein